jgi:hypothetical protein
MLLECRASSAHPSRCCLESRLCPSVCVSVRLRSQVRLSPGSSCPTSVRDCTTSPSYVTCARVRFRLSFSEQTLLYLSGDAAERRHRTGRERKGAHTPGRRFKIQSCCCLGCAFDGRTLLASSTLQGKVDDNAGVILSGVGHVASIAARSRRCKSWSATAFPPLRHGLVATVHHTAGAGVGSCPSCSPKSGRGPRTWFSRLNTGERESSPLPGMTAGMGNRPPLYSWNCRANVYVCVHSADSLRGHQHPPYQSVQTKPPRLALAVAML